MKHSILALDLGSNIGFAFDHVEDDEVEVGSLLFTGNRIERAAKFLNWFEAFLEVRKHPFDLIAYERPFARGMHATRSLWGLAGIIEAVGQSHGAAVYDVTPAEIKKHATGSGRASKDDMLLFATTTGYGGNNEHEADAWCLLRYAEQHLKWEDPS